MKAIFLTGLLVSCLLSAPAAIYYGSRTRAWDMQIRFASEKPPETTTTDQQAQAVLSQSMYPQQQPAPTPFDVLRQADNATHGANAPINRLRIAGVLHTAIGLINETRIRSIEEYNAYAGRQFPAVLGSDYETWQPFLHTMDNLASGLNKSGQFQSMADVAKYFGGVEQLLREGR
jgi:hypothetical protein